MCYPSENLEKLHMTKQERYKLYSEIIQCIPNEKRGARNGFIVSSCGSKMQTVRTWNCASHHKPIPKPKLFMLVDAMRKNEIPISADLSSLYL